MGLPIKVISPVKSIIFLRFYRETAWVNEMTDSARVFEVLKQASFDLPCRDCFAKGDPEKLDSTLNAAQSQFSSV